MSSYRDPLNPEAIHFPGKLSTRILFVVLIGFLVLLSIAVLFAREETGRKIVELGVIGFALLVILAAWPPEIITSETGIRQHRFLRLGERFVAWPEVTAIRRSPELFGLFGTRAGGIETTRVVIESVNGSPRIVHSSLHSDMARFLKEVERRSGKSVS